MDNNKAQERTEIIAALRTECADCSERHWCNNGTNGVGVYCPVLEAATLLERNAEQPNPPLTLTELRGMDGEPVRIVETMTAQLAALQAENAELKQRLDKVNDFEKSQCAKLMEELSRVEAERDAAIADVSRVCATCGQFEDGACPVLVHKDYPKDCEHWCWRGAQGEG